MALPTQVAISPPGRLSFILFINLLFLIYLFILAYLQVLGLSLHVLLFFRSGFLPQAKDVDVR